MKYTIPIKALIAAILFLQIACRHNDKKNKPDTKIVAKVKHTNNLTKIHIIPLGIVSEQSINDVAFGLKSFYHNEIIIEKMTPLTADLLAPSRTRYSASLILRHFNPNQNTLIITEKDITCKKNENPEWGIFGLGLRPGKICVVSTKRLKRNATPLLLTERLQKVSIHEVGHNLGLNHCTNNKECLMNDACGTIKQVDREKIFFCEGCKKIIGMK